MEAVRNQTYDGQPRPPKYVQTQVGGTAELLTNPSQAYTPASSINLTTAPTKRDRMPYQVAVGFYDEDVADWMGVNLGPPAEPRQNGLLRSPSPRHFQQFGQIQGHAAPSMDSLFLNVPPGTGMGERPADVFSLTDQSDYWPQGATTNGSNAAGPRSWLAAAPNPAGGGAGVSPLESPRTGYGMSGVQIAGLQDAMPSAGGGSSQGRHSPVNFPEDKLGWASHTSAKNFGDGQMGPGAGFGAFGTQGLGGIGMAPIPGGIGGSQPLQGMGMAPIPPMSSTGGSNQAEWRIFDF